MLSLCGGNAAYELMPDIQYLRKLRDTTGLTFHRLLQTTKGNFPV
jgi:hypothetical protein